VQESFVSGADALPAAAAAALPVNAPACRTPAMNARLPGSMHASLPGSMHARLPGFQARVLRAMLLVAACASAVGGAAAPAVVSMQGFQRIGHDIVVDPALRRFTAKVVAVGKPGDDGKIYSFTVEPIGPGIGLPVAKELRGWRLTVLSGARFLGVFEVADNQGAEITIGKTQAGGLNGLAPGDVFIVEDIPAQAPEAT